MSANPPSSPLLERARQAHLLVRRDPATARKLVEEVLGEVTSAEPAAHAQALLSRATLAQRDSRHGDSIRDIQASLALARVADHQNIVTQCHNLLGLQYHALGDDRAALEQFHTSIRQAEAQGDEDGRIRASGNLAMVMHSQGDREGALKIYRDVLAHPGIQTNAQALAQTRHNLAQTSWDLGRDLPQCAELFTQAAAGKRQLGDSWSLALSLCSLSGVQRDLGQFEAARQTLDEIAALIQAHPSPELRFYHRLNLGMWLAAEANSARDLTAAQTELESALAAALETKAPEVEIRAREYLAQVRHAAGQHAEAYQELKRSSTLLQDLQKEESRRRIERLQVVFEAEQARRDALHERQRREEAEAFTNRIQEQNRRLEALNKEKSDIIGLIAHDLRSPLSSALALIEDIAAAPQDADNVTAGTRALIVNQRQMLDLTRTLLDLEAIESGTLQARPGHVDFAALFASTQETHASTLTAKGIEVEVTPIIGNEDWLGPVLYVERAFENLFSNALKYTPRGGRITLAAATTPDGVELRVADTGPGIPPARRDRMFEKFTTLGTPPTGGEAAHGLGLYLARCCAQQTGGDLRYEDAPGGGACFVLTLPHPLAG